MPIHRGARHRRAADYTIRTAVRVQRWPLRARDRAQFSEQRGGLRNRLALAALPHGIRVLEEALPGKGGRLDEAIGRVVSESANVTCVLADDRHGSVGSCHLAFTEEDLCEVPVSTAAASGQATRLWGRRRLTRPRAIRSPG